MLHQWILLDFKWILSFQYLHALDVALQVCPRELLYQLLRMFHYEVSSVLPFLVQCFLHVLCYDNVHHHFPQMMWRSHHHFMFQLVQDGMVM